VTCNEGLRGGADAWLVAPNVSAAPLLVTELVANALDHVQGAAGPTLEVAVSDGWLRIAVVDASPVRPVVREPGHGQPRGRGLLLVTAIADRWGSEDHRGGKIVWFELSPPAG
jgi:hypothetical protein